MLNWRFREIFPLCASEIKKRFTIWCAAAEPFRCAVYRCFRTENHYREKQNPRHEIFPPCPTVFAEFRLAGASARSPVNLPVLVLTLSALRRLLTVYLSSHLVRPVLWRLCVYEVWSTLEAVSSFPISDLGADGVGSSSLLIWMFHALASSFEWCSRGRRASKRFLSPFVRLFTFKRGSV